MVESPYFLLNVIAKDLYTILASVLSQWIHDLSVHKGTVGANPKENVVVDLSHV